MKIKEGQIVEGEITRVVDEGAFVDIGTKRRAVISRKDIQKLDPNQLEKIAKGEHIEVYVTHAPKNGVNPLLSVSKALMPVGERDAAISEPVEELKGWAIVEDAYQVGDQVEGVVTHIRKYGAFVKLPIGIEGLIHISKMEPGFTPSPWDIVNEGDEILAEVIQIEPQRQRIGLSLVEVRS